MNIHLALGSFGGRGWREGGRKGGVVVGETVRETVQQAHREGSMPHTKDGDTAKCIAALRTKITNQRLAPVVFSFLMK